jgi:hypothetical protein
VLADCQNDQLHTSSTDNDLRDEAHLGAISIDPNHDSDSMIVILKHLDLHVNMLLDSGASHCFIDTQYAYLHSLPLSPLPKPLLLCLFDGSFGQPITHFTQLSVRFPSGHRILIQFLLTSLDPSVSALLGCCWL